MRSRSQPDLLWSHDDSGAGPILFGLRADGRVAARPTVTGAQAVDWEDIAAGPARTAGRCSTSATSATTRRAGPPSTSTASPSRASAPRPPLPAARLRLRYPDGAHDAEALLVDPLRGDLVIVTKALGAARAYRASARLPAGSQTTLRRGPRDQRSRSSPPAT